MRTIILEPGTRQQIGRSGDTGVTVQFRALPWYQAYPAGLPYLMVTAPGGVRIPVTVTYADGMISGVVPDELILRPGLYTYEFAWVSAGEQVQSSPCGAIVLEGETPRRWNPHSAAPDWADRIFLAAEAIEGKTAGIFEAAAAAQDAMETADSAKNDAEDARDAAAASEQAAAASEENIETILTNMEQTIADAEEAMNGIEDQKNTMIESIAAIAEMGTDTTMTQSGVAADAKAVGDLKSALSELPPVKDSDKVGVDLDISDPQGNVILRLANGHIHTKYFHSKPTIITLKPTGGDFSTLKAALDSIIDADPETNPYEIHIYPGTYDTLEGFTDAEIRSADIGGGYTDNSMVGCKLTNGISLIGIGDRGKIILTAELSASDYPLSVRGNISTLNLQGTCRIENLTIKAKNIRYCIHDDFGSDDHYVRIVKNCAFSAYSWSTAYYPATTYGAGIANPGITALFEDCDFGFNFGYHTRQYMTGDSDLVFKHCRGLVARLGDSSRETDESIHRFHFDGCDFSAISITRPTATTPHIFIDGTNNLSTMLFCKAEDIPQFASIMKATVSALPVGTVVKVNNGSMTTASAGIMAAKADSIESAIGVIVHKDSEYDYIQTEGYIQGYLLGIAGLSVGDYITCDSDMMLTNAGATVTNAFGVVKYTDDDDNSQIWMIKGRG